MTGCSRDSKLRVTNVMELNSYSPAKATPARIPTDPRMSREYVLLLGLKTCAMESATSPTVGGNAKRYLNLPARVLKRFLCCEPEMLRSRRWRTRLSHAHGDARDAFRPIAASRYVPTPRRLRRASIE